MKQKKMVAIGDIHGSPNWKQVVKAEKENIGILFIGDYFDSFYIPGTDQIENFKQIVKFKLDNPERVVMLTGNHDIHYLKTIHERYSGYQPEHANEIGNLVAPLIKNKTMVACHAHGKFLFTHAGVTKTWESNVGISGFEAKPIDLIINDLLLTNIEAFCYNKNDKTGYGENVQQGPMWVRPDSLMSDTISGFVQVVGHTNQGHINYQKGAIFIDTFDTSGEYLGISSGKATTKNYAIVH